jgi:hypothetical protein
MKQILSLIFLILISFSVWSQVKPAWIKEYLDTGISEELINDMEVDGQGNVYLTGSQKGPIQNTRQAITLKYDSKGTLLWSKSYEAFLKNGAFGKAIHVDKAGNVYITGETAIVSGGANEMLTIKYNPDGSVAWSNRFQYVNKFLTSGQDIITDDDGNVYVAGEFYAGTHSDVLLVKFSSGGALENQVVYDKASEGGRKIAIDKNGFILIAGFQNLTDTIQYLGLKYSSDLNLVWAKGWANPAMPLSNVLVNDMELDAAGDMIITGQSNLDFGTIKVKNSDGSLLWANLYNEAYDAGRGVAIDAFGNVYVTGETSVSGNPFATKIVTIKYNSSGAQTWLRNYNGGNKPDGYSSNDIALDDSNHVFVVGSTYSNQDIATVKYSESGDLLWAINYNGNGNGADAGVKLATDAVGNVYVTGNSMGSSSGNDIVLAKYISAANSIFDLGANSKRGFVLEQNIPNPVNDFTTIRFRIPEFATSSNLKLSLSDVSGKVIKTLMTEKAIPGDYSFELNTSQIPAGIYIYHLESGAILLSKKMVVIH